MFGRRLGMTKAGSLLLTVLIVLTTASVVALWVEFVLGKDWNADIEVPVTLILAGLVVAGLFAVDRLVQWVASLCRRAARFVR